MPKPAPQDQTHVHDYKPTKAGTYWKVCQCGARKHFAQDQTQADKQKNDIALRLYRLRYTELNEFSQEFVDDVVGLIDQYANQRALEARIESLQWALNDYSMPDTDTRKNLEGFIADLEAKRLNLTKEK